MRRLRRTLPLHEPRPLEPPRDAKAAAKEYAWMDSGDEGGDDRASVVSAASSEAALPEAKLPASVGDIETFTEFLRMTPALKKTCDGLPAAELVALCETAARVKYFDGDLFKDVFKQLCARFSKNAFDFIQATAVIAALVELNACDAHVFGAAKDALLPRVGEMPKALRLQWLKLLVAAGHAYDGPFEEALRMAPLLPGEDGAVDDFMMCWEYVKGGFCPRGSKCKWFHPPPKGTGAAAGTPRVGF